MKQGPKINEKQFTFYICFQVNKLACSGISHHLS